MKRELLPANREELISELKTRFEENMGRHKGLDWDKVLAKLEADPAKLWTLSEMERTGGEPDVVGFDKRRASTYFLIAHPKAPNGAGASVTTAKRGSPERNTNRKAVLSKWRPRWALRS